MLDLTIRLRKQSDGLPAAREAVAKLAPADLELLVAFAQGLCQAYEERNPNGLIVFETRVVTRP